MQIEYVFQFQDERGETITLEFDDETMALAEPRNACTPDWAMLDFHRCPNCPLKSESCIYCPLAKHLAGIVGKFDDIVSYDTLEIEVVTTERKISQTTSAQHAIGSLLGLVFATSGCPHTVYFRPMARFHLPLASNDETAYRATSMYLLAQYFIAKDGGEPDMDLDGLRKIYDNIQEVNIAVAGRIRAATKTDSSINAVILLDMFAKNIPYVISDSLENVRHLFKAWDV